MKIFHPINPLKHGIMLSHILICAGYFLFPWKLNQGTAILAIGLLLLSILDIKNIKLKINDPLIVALILFLILVIFQTRESTEYLNESKADSISRYYKYLFSILAIMAMKDGALRKRSMQAFFLSVLLIVISMHLNIFWNLPWSNPTIKGWGNDQTVVGDYITQNLFVCIFSLISLDFLIKSKEIKRQAFFIIAFLLGIHGILFLSIGRTGYVLVSISLGIYALWAIKSSMKWVVLIGICSCIFIFINTSPHASQRVQLALQEARSAITSIESDEAPELTSIGARIYMWDQTWKIIQAKPIIGWGVGGYPQAWCNQVPKNWCNDTAKYHPHNQYLMFWVELGFLGVTLFLFIIFILAKNGFKDKKNGGILLVFIGMLFFDSFINSPLYVRREYQLFLLMIPLLYSYTRQEKNS